MPNKYADLVALCAQPRPPVTPREARAAAVQSLQSSLFNRLRKARGGPLAGKLAWLLIRAGQDEHKENAAALEALAGFSRTDLSLFAIACEGARDSLPGAASAAAAASLAAVEGVAASREIGGVGVGGVDGAP